jgi:hypothetical protein
MHLAGVTLVGRRPAARLEPPARPATHPLALPPIRSTLDAPMDATLARIAPIAPQERPAEPVSPTSQKSPKARGQHQQGGGTTFLTGVEFEEEARADAEDYIAAQISIINGVSEPVDPAIRALVRRLERLCVRYSVPRMLVDRKLLQTLTTLPSVPQLHLLDSVLNHGEVQRYMKLPGFKFRGANRKLLAAAYIQASWRMVVGKRRFKQTVARQSAAARVQVAIRALLLTRGLRARLRALREERRKIFRSLQYEFGTEWRSTRRRVEVHIASLGVKLSRRLGKGGWDPQFARLFRAAEQNVEVVFVCPDAPHPDILDYFFSICKARNLSDAKIVTVVPEIGVLCPQISLTAALLCSPRALTRIQKLIQYRNAVLVPAIPHAAEVDLSAFLGIPILGADPRTYASLAAKSALPGITRLAKVATPHTEIDISRMEFFQRFAEVVTSTMGKKWAVKIDDELGGHGSMLVDLTEYWRYVVTVDVYGLEQLLEHVVSRCRPQSPEKYPTVRAFLDELTKSGCVIQQVPENAVSYPSAHILIEPDGHVEVVSTSEAIRAPQTHFLTAAHLYPHSVGGHAVVEAGLRVGKALAMKGVLGFATVDCVVFPSPDYDANAAATAARELGGGEGTEVTVLGAAAPQDSRMFTTESPEPGVEGAVAAVDPAFLLGGDRSLQAQLSLAQPEAGQRRNPDDLMVDPEPPSQALEHLVQVVDVDLRWTEASVGGAMVAFVAECDASAGQLVTRAHREPRHAVLAPVTVPRLRNTTYATLFSAAKQHGVSFDLLRNLGTLFADADVHLGNVAPATVATTRAAAVHGALQTLGVLERSGRRPETGPHVPEPEFAGVLVAAANSALRALQRKLDRPRNIMRSSE